MDYEVLKPFKSVNRRFVPGEGLGGVVKESDDIAPHSIETLMARDFIRPKDEMVSGLDPAPGAPVAPQHEDEDDK